MILRRASSSAIKAAEEATSLPGERPRLRIPASNAAGLSRIHLISNTGINPWVRQARGKPAGDPHPAWGLPPAPQDCARRTDCDRSGDEKTVDPRCPTQALPRTPPSFPSERRRSAYSDRGWLAALPAGKTQKRMARLAREMTVLEWPCAIRLRRINPALAASSRGQLMRPSPGPRSSGAQIIGGPEIMGGTTVGPARRADLKGESSAAIRSSALPAIGAGFRGSAARSQRPDRGNPK
jgi:hypothetical protein